MSDVGGQPASRARGRLDIHVAAAADHAALARLNARLRAGGVSYRLPLDAALRGERRAPAAGFPVFREMLVASDGEEIRAGLLLYHAALWLDGAERPFCWVQLPVSEGLVDARHALAIVSLLKTVLAQQPLLMSLGIGSLGETYAQVLRRLGWRHAAVPFFVHAVQPARVLRHLPYLRTRPRLALAARLLAGSGAASAAGAGLALLRRRWRAGLRAYEVRVEPRFDEWADRIYQDARPAYGAAVCRDAATLDIRYPRDDTRFLRLRVRQGGAEIGWIVVAHTRMSGSRYFGDLHVGTLIDGFGRPAAAATLVRAGLELLAEAGVELVVANWSHEAWQRAARASGFVAGPSNFFLFVSSKGETLLGAGCPLARIHMTRGDNDTPSHLLPPLQPSAPPQSPGESAQASMRGSR